MATPRRGDDHVVEELIREGAHGNVKDTLQKSALYWASGNDHCSVVIRLPAAALLRAKLAQFCEHP